MSAETQSNDSPGPRRCARAILHGLAARRDDVRSAIERVRADGHEVEVRVTWEAGDARRLTREALREEAGMLIAGGGDGTLNAVVQEVSVARTKGMPIPTLGLVPLGTANDFAGGAGLPIDPLAALTFALGSVAVPVDVVQVNERYFVNVATAGFGSQVTVATPEGMKKILGGMAYFFTALAQATQLEPLPVRLGGTDFSWEGEFLVLAIGNGRQVGGGHVLCPEALLDDGAFDLCLVPHLPDVSRARSLSEYAVGGIEAIEQKVVARRMNWLELTARDELQLNLDGEPMAGSHFRFDVRPHHLRMHLPSETPILRAHQD